MLHQAAPRHYLSSFVQYALHIVITKWRSVGDCLGKDLPWVLVRENVAYASYHLLVEGWLGIDNKVITPPPSVTRHRFIGRQLQVILHYFPIVWSQWSTLFIQHSYRGSCEGAPAVEDTNVRMMTIAVHSGNRISLWLLDCTVVSYRRVKYVDEAFNILLRWYFS